ncbi:hypothetical protein GCM10023063_17010 [Arthrobacter methylotrophus]
MPSAPTMTDPPPLSGLQKWVAECSGIGRLFRRASLKRRQRRRAAVVAVAVLVFMGASRNGQERDEMCRVKQKPAARMGQRVSKLAARLR